ncbi:phage head spike fiber domain-containing protein [Aeromonas media]|uniref:phage head spike fiber domain-containing protein n=1 Tax=Aeromonas media TaxID=651 RepID=UPI0038CF73C4
MAGVWKRDGTVAVTNGNKKVTGTGTTFADTKNGVAKGHLFCITSGTSVDFYEVDYVVSNTELYLVQAYRGVTATGKAYEIITTFSDSVPEFARRLTATLSAYQQQSDAFQALLTSTATTVEVTAPDGTKQTLIPWKRVTSEGEGQAARAKTEADKAAASAALAGDIVAASALPLPDVWAPLTDSLRLFTGYGREVKVGDDVIARMLTFSRSTTKTYTNRDGVLTTAAVNEPTFDQWGLSLDGLALNLVKYHNAFTVWGAGSVATANQPGPFNANDATRFDVTSRYTGSNPELTAALVDGAVYTTSVWLKGAVGGEVVRIGIHNGSVGVPVTLTTEWKRYSVTQTRAAGANAAFIIQADSAHMAFFIYGAQLENNPVASALVPTNGAAATRSADLLTLQNPLNIPVGAGDMTVAFEVRRNQTIPSSWFPKIFQIGPNTWLLGDSTRFAMRGGTTDQGALLKPAPGEMETVVYRIKGNQIMVRCGNAVVTLTRTGAITANLMVTNIGSDGLGFQNLFGHVRNLRVWRRALTDDQMKAIA